MSNGAKPATARRRVNLNHAADVYGAIYVSKKAAFDRAFEEAVQRALASGNVETLGELLSRLDQMTGQYRDV